MPEPTTVWWVQLDRTSDDVEGTLSLEDDVIRFRSALDQETRTIGLTDITRVKRILGSPVLLIRSTEADTKRVTAFYFSKPPPLHPPEREPDAPAPTTIVPRPGQRRSTSRRKQRRNNAGYLASTANVVARDLQAWVKETRAAVAAARGGSG